MKDRLYYWPSDVKPATTCGGGWNCPDCGKTNTVSYITHDYCHDCGYTQGYV